MRTTTKQSAEESGEAALASVVMDMIARGETHRELIGYHVSVRLEVEPRFIDTSKAKEGSR